MGYPDAFHEPCQFGKSDPGVRRQVVAHLSTDDGEEAFAEELFQPIIRKDVPTAEGLHPEAAFVTSTWASVITSLVANVFNR